MRPIWTKPMHQLRKRQEDSCKNMRQKSTTILFLLTSPKAFGFNFNPVSFFYFLNASNKIIGIIAEVHNTFNEKHIYLLTKPKEEGNYLTFESEKEFHVSQFFKTEGKYCLFQKKSIG